MATGWAGVLAEVGTEDKKKWKAASLNTDVFEKNANERRKLDENNCLW